MNNVTSNSATSQHSAVSLYDVKSASGKDGFAMSGTSPTPALQPTRQVDAKKRFTRSHPCPICYGHEKEDRGKGKRCFGFLSNDGRYTHCTREEYAGSLFKNPDSETYAHKLIGDCKCGIRHDLSPATRTTAEYNYRDEKGNLLYQVVRLEPKGFFQRRPDGAGGWIRKLDGVRRVLYRLPELLAVDAQAIVHVCEGEKDCDRLAALGLVATTNSGGAGKWRDEYSQFLRGRHVVILPDNDEAGREHAERVAASLESTVASVRIVNLPDLPEKGDVSDWLNAGGTAEQLEIIIEKVEPLSSLSSLNSKEHRAPLHDSAGRMAFPRLDSKALYGIAGEFVQAIFPHTEADSAALLIQLLVGVGNIIGRNAYYVADGARHYPNLFCLIVGRTNAAKGSALAHVKNLLRRIDDVWAQHRVKSGLSSGEGLIKAVDDADGGVDKRLLVTESEFASVLKMNHREGNILSPVIRGFWDDGSASTMTKNNPVSATDAHVSIIGHITPEELRECLGSVEIANGYANRFLFAYVRRSKDLPDGGNLSESVLSRLVMQFQKAIPFAQSVREMRRDEQAGELWRRVYPSLVADKAGAFGKAVARARAQIVRLSCLYALLDCSQDVRRVHLEAAIAAWQYCEDSARYVFGGNRISDDAQKLIDAANRAGVKGLDRTAQHVLFKGKRTSDELDAAEKELVNAKLVRVETVVTPGRPKKLMFALAENTTRDSEESEFIEESSS